MSPTNKIEAPAAVPVLVRAGVVAIVIGCVLTALNQPAAVFGEAAFLWIPLALVFLTPFLVVSLSQVLGFRAARRAGLRSAQGGSFFQTLASNSILRRALLVGLVACGGSTGIAVSGALLSDRGLDQVSIPLILQALFLPIVFGALSQTLAFRREWVAMQGRRVQATDPTSDAKHPDTACKAQPTGC